MSETKQICWIYRSPRKEGMYLYLKEEEGFDKIPTDLMQRFGKPQLVMQMELHPERKLAREDASQVLQNLQARGYHLQLPPQLSPELYFGD